MRLESGSAPLPTGTGPLAGLAAGCDSPEYHRLDFWIGAWDVTNPKGELEGTNAIERISGGCAIEEHWTDAEGHVGTSLFHFDRQARIWKQVWVTDEGPTKEKSEQPGAVAGAVRFEGKIPRLDGGVVRDRTTLTAIDGGKVRQVIEQSIDDGKTWKAWEGVYTRASRPACAAAEQRAFDFWLGDWDLVVRARNTPDAPWTEARGSNHVTSTLGGCVVQEQFAAAGPGTPWAGHSVSQWVPAEKAWRQTWVDDSGGYLPFHGGMVNGEMILTGEAKPDGHVMRMVFTGITHEHFTWRWEGAKDGKTWTPVMTIDYRRRG